MQLDPIASTLGMAGCLMDWFITRSWKAIALFFLPLALAALVGGLVAAGSYLSRDALADRYLTLANAEVMAWEAQWAPVGPVAATTAPTENQSADSNGSSNQADTSTPAANPATANPTDARAKIPREAEMLFRRVQQLQQNDRRSVFFVAMSYIQRGAEQQGMSMLNRIAPGDSVGYLPAHAYLLEQNLKRNLTARDLPAVRHHALATMRWERAPAALLAAISQLLFNFREMDNAVDAMQKAAARDPTYRLPLAKIASVDEKYKPLAEQSLKTVTQHFVSQLDRNPQDVSTRLLLADSYCHGGDYLAAEKVLADGLRLDEQPQLKSALSEVYRRAFTATSRFSGTTWSGDIELLEKAYRLDPNNLLIYEQVAKLARISGSSPHGELMSQLHKKLAEGKATSVTHTWIAEHYLIRNEYDKAIPHLEQAIKRDPLASRSWNNLAYCVADRQPERLEDALKYADQALAIAPQMPDFHDTRGTVLMKMQRYSDAVAAFEKAIEVAHQSRGFFLPQPAYHERVAEAYRAAGNDAMAEAHLETARELAEKLALAKAQIEAAQAAKAKESEAASQTQASQPSTPSDANATNPSNSPAGEADATQPVEPSASASDPSASDPSASDPGASGPNELSVPATPSSPNDQPQATLPQQSPGTDRPAGS